LASKLVGWDIEIMTHDELNESIEKAEAWFRVVPHVSDELVEAFIEEGFMSYDDLSFCDPAELVEMAGITEEEAEEIINYAEKAAERLERGEEPESKEGAGTGETSDVYSEHSMPTEGTDELNEAEGLLEEQN